jgi:hypothetical protein
MDIKPYPNGEFLPITRQLYKMGVLRKYPTQIKRDDLVTDKGVDIVYYLKGLTPAVFKEMSASILMAAYQEAHRYETEAKYKFAKITVDLNLSSKGTSKGISETRDYIAAKNPDSETMVWGTGISLPEGESNPFLISKVEAIIGLLESESPGPYLKRKTPYQVRTLVICLREGWRESRKNLIDKISGDLNESKVIETKESKEAWSKVKRKIPEPIETEESRKAWEDLKRKDN